jgi:hypothetical protein
VYKPCCTEGIGAAWLEREMVLSDDINDKIGDSRSWVPQRKKIQVGQDFFFLKKKEDWLIVGDLRGSC